MGRIVLDKGIVFCIEHKDARDASTFNGADGKIVKMEAKPERYEVSVVCGEMKDKAIGLCGAVNLRYDLDFNQIKDFKPFCWVECRYEYGGNGKNAINKPIELTLLKGVN